MNQDLTVLYGSVSDPFTSNTDPDPWLWLNTDLGSQHLILIKPKKYFELQSFLGFHNTNNLVLNPTVCKKIPVF